MLEAVIDVFPLLHITFETAHVTEHTHKLYLSSLCSESMEVQIVSDMLVDDIQP